LLVGVPEAVGKHLDDIPEQLGLIAVDAAKRSVRNGDDLRRLKGSGFGGTREAIEQRHFAEQIAAFHECNY